MALKEGLLYRLSLSLVGPIFNGITYLLFGSCRIAFKGWHHYEQYKSANKPFIAAFWHYGIFYILHFGRKKGSWVAMVSGSKDGEYVARILENMGFEPVRGSRGKGGLAALKEIQAAMARGRNAAIVADGSQGPARIVQAGIILLASRTSIPILPGSWAANRYWAFKSWDRTVLPKPFARVEMVIGEPLEVPPKIRSKDLEEYRRELEKRLNNLYDEAWGAFGKKEH